MEEGFEPKESGSKAGVLTHLPWPCPMRWSGDTLGELGPDSTEVWTGMKATMHAKAPGREGRSRCQGPLQELLSFLEGLIEPGQQKGIFQHNPGMAPVLFSTCLLSLYIVFNEHLLLCCRLRAKRHHPFPQHQGQTCMEHREHARP